MRDILKGRPYKRHLSTMAVNINNGHIIVFDETTPEKYRADAIVAGASFPGAFPPIKIGNMLLNDGGIFDNLNLAEAVV